MKRPKVSIFERIGALAQHKSSWIIWSTVIITLLLCIPIFLMAPTERALDNPGGEVFDIRDEIEEKLPLSVHQIPFIIEAKDGDILTQKELWELYQNEEKLRQSEIGRNFLYTRYDIENNQMIFGVYTIADAVQAFFEKYPKFETTLKNATDNQVKLAIHYILTNPESSGLANWFSKKATHKTRIVYGLPIDYWESPALMFRVNIDNSRLPREKNPGLAAGSAGGREHQRLNREVQTLLRGNEASYQLWGVAIDLTLESEEEGKANTSLIVATLVLIFIIVFIQFRSRQIVLLTMLGLGMLMIWLNGLSNLIGLRSSLILDMIIPVVVLVMGVAYAIYAVHRYREEREKEVNPGNTLLKSIAGVGSALTLAMLTTVIAFLSNVSSGIEAIRGFGIAAAVAIFSALIIMGLFIPTLKMRLDVRKPLASKQIRKKQSTLPGRIVCSIADRRLIVLPLVLLVSIVAGFFALNLETKLDAKEFLDNNSDFVVSIDKLDEHIGEKSGEQAFIYIKGDLSEPESLLAIQNMINNMDDDQTIARRTSDERPYIKAEIFEFLKTVLKSDVARAKIEAFGPGITISDLNQDGIPDRQEQLKVIYNYIVQFGIPLSDKILYYEPSQIRESLFRDPSGVKEEATLVTTFIPGAREQTIVKESRSELIEDMEALQVPFISFFGLTGPGYERTATLDAITNALVTSLLISVILCFLILLIAFRSFKYSIVTVIPVILVAVWLYAFMYFAGFHLNAVTATIAAISIGVGIDFSVHITARFRQEIRETLDKRTALVKTANQTGSALFGATIATSLGFAVLVLAPMPMFSSFGMLTALMILMAFVAALLVLPSLLMLIAKEKNVKGG